MVQFSRFFAQKNLKLPIITRYYTELQFIDGGSPAATDETRREPGRVTLVESREWSIQKN